MEDHRGSSDMRQRFTVGQSIPATLIDTKQLSVFNVNMYYINYIIYYIENLINTRTCTMSYQ